MFSAKASRIGPVGGAVVLNNEPVRQPKLPVLRVLAFTEGLERSAKNTVFTIQNLGFITIVAANGALECG
jgi:hypothetical protein